MRIGKWLILLPVFTLIMVTLFPITVDASLSEDIANTPIWSRSYDGGGDDYALDAAVDSDDNVLVGGVYWNSQAQGWCYNIIKYDGDGKSLWERSWNTGKSTGDPLIENFGEYSISLAVDSQNNIVAGSNQTPQGRRYIVKYSPEGTLLWETTYNSGGGENIEGNSLAIDSDDNILSVGTSFTSSGAVPTLVKYSPDGKELLSRQLMTTSNGANGFAVAIDSQNNAVVCGQAPNDVAWLYKQDAGASELWSKTDLSYLPGAVAMDSQDNILVTGLGWRGTSIDYQTTKYDPSGNVLWVTTYDSGYTEYGAFDIAIDLQDNATVVGLSYLTEWREGGMTRGELIDFMKTADYVAVTYDSSGKTVCKRVYDGGHGDWGTSIATDSVGNVVLTGASYDGSTFNYVTVKYPPVRTPTVGVYFGTAYAYQVQGDSFTNSQVEGFMSWGSSIWPNVGLPVTGITLSLDSPTNYDWATPTPAVTGPPQYRWSLGDIVPLQVGYYGKDISVGINQSPVIYSPGFDISSTADKTRFTTSSTQTLTLTVTARQPIPSLALAVEVSEDDYVNPTIIAPTTDETIDMGLSPDNRVLQISINNPSVNVPYVIEVKLNVVLKQGVTALDFMPKVGACWNEMLQIGYSEDASSVSYSMQGVGKWTWNSTGSYSWGWQANINRGVYFASYSSLAPGIISGRITNTGTGEAIPGVRVEAIDTVTGQLATGSVTGPDGTYSMELPQGDYFIQASPSKSGLPFFDILYSGVKTAEEAEPVHVGSGLTASGIDFILEPIKAAEAEESFTGSVPLPEQVSTDPEVIGTNVLLTSFLVVLFYFAATLFNGTFKENYETIQAWSRRFASRFRLSKPRSRPPFGASRGSKRLLEIALILLVTAAINSVVDPGFGLNLNGLILFTAMIMTSIAATFGYDGVRVLVSRHGFHLPATIKAYPLAILLAIIFVSMSRLMAFYPGLIFGFVGAFAFLPSAVNPDTRQRSVGILWGILVVILMALSAFFLRQPLASMGEGFWRSMLDTVLVAVFVGGLEGLLFGLLPLTFLDGGTLASWKKWVWLVVFAVVVFLFFHTVVNQAEVLTGAVKDMKVVVIFSLVAASAVLSLVFWAYFRMRTAREQRRRFHFSV